MDRNIRKGTASWVIAAFVAGSMAMSSFAARSVDWPAAYEADLAAHVAATTPSGDQAGASSVFAAFDSRIVDWGEAFFAELRNYPVPGLTIIFR